MGYIRVVCTEYQPNESIHKVDLEQTGVAWRGKNPWAFVMGAKAAPEIRPRTDFYGEALPWRLPRGHGAAATIGGYFGLVPSPDARPDEIVCGRTWHVLQSGSITSRSHGRNHGVGPRNATASRRHNCALDCAVLRANCDLCAIARPRHRVESGASVGTQRGFG